MLQGYTETGRWLARDMQVPTAMCKNLLVVIGALGACSGSDRPAIQPARTGVVLATGLPFVSEMVVHAQHVYLAVEAPDDRTRLVRVAKAGGPVEELTTLDLDVRTLFVDGDGLVVAGPAPSAGGARSVIGRVDLRAPWTLRVAFDGPWLVSRVVQLDGVIYALADDGPQGTPGNQLCRLEDGALVQVPITGGPDAIDHFSLAAGDKHLFVVDDEAPTLFALRPDGTRLWWNRWTDVRLSHDIQAAGRFVFALADDRVNVIDSELGSDPANARDPNVEDVIEDLKGPRMVAIEGGVIVSTLGDIAHIPGYRGAVLAYDATARAARVIFDGAPRPLAADADFVYGVDGAALIRIPRK
jgi:hypothetical protein